MKRIGSIPCGKAAATRRRDINESTQWGRVLFSRIVGGAAVRFAALRVLPCRLRSGRDSRDQRRTVGGPESGTRISVWCDGSSPFCRCRESARELSSQEGPPRGHCEAGDDRSCHFCSFQTGACVVKEPPVMSGGCTGMNQAVCCYSPYRHVHFSLAWSGRSSWWLGASRGRSFLSSARVEVGHV